MRLKRLSTRSRVYAALNGIILSAVGVPVLLVSIAAIHAPVDRVMWFAAVALSSIFIGLVLLVVALVGVRPTFAARSGRELTVPPAAP